MKQTGSRNTIPQVQVQWHGTRYPVAVPHFNTDYIQREMVASGRPYEEEMLAAMAEIVAEDDLVLDVGANVGNHTLFLAHVCGAIVAAYEPNPPLVAALLQSVTLGALEGRVIVRACAVGSKSARGRMDDLGESNLGSQSVAEDPDGGFDIIRLDDENLDSRVKVIKVDVEGMELEVLRGAEQLIKRDLPLLYVECRDSSEFAAVEGWLDGLGYGLADTFNVTPTHLFRPGHASNSHQVQALKRNALVRYKLDERYRRMKEFLRVADARTAAASEKLKQASDELEQHEMQVKSKSAALDRVRAEALSYRDQRDELRKRLEEVRVELGEKNAALAVASKDSAAQLSRVKAEHKRDVARLRRRLKDLESSRSVRLVRLAHASTKTPLSMIRSVPQIVRLLRNTNSESRRPGPSPVPTKDMSPAETGVEVPIGRVDDPQLNAELVIVRGGIREFDANVLRTKSDIARQSGESLLGRLTSSSRLPRVAAITDDFTRNGMSPECDWLDLTPESWLDDMKAFEPDVLFVESAWRGKSDAWHNTVPRLPEALQAILEYCRANSVPTLFWNKEDPVHFDTFMRVAVEFDHVLTTDIDCIPRYRVALGHDRVHFMPFACQPRVHNPMENRARRDGLAFAGGYYTRYKERMRDLEEILTGATGVMSVDIFDRNLGTTFEEYSFPDHLKSYIVGTLSADDLDIAYKGYRFALNLNSVKDSQSMFARRAYELLASGTVTISNYAHGLGVMLGDLIPMGDSRAWTKSTLTELTANSEYYDRLRLMGLRKVHSEHTYGARLDYLLAAATNREYVRRKPLVDVLVPVLFLDDIDRMIEVIKSQIDVEVRTTFVAKSADITEHLRAKDLRVLGPDELRDLAVADLCEASVGLAVLDPRDWHGPTYLVDLALAVSYSGADVVGRQNFAAFVEGTIRMPNRGWAYSDANGMTARCGMLANGARTLEIRSVLHDSADALSPFSQFTIDRFDYCRDGASADQSLLKPLLGSSSEIRTGIDLEELYRFLKHENKISAQRPRQVLAPSAWLASTGPKSKVKVEVGDLTVTFTSKLDDDRHVYRWLRHRIPADLIAQGGNLKFMVATSGDLDLSIGIRFINIEGELIHSLVRPANRFVSVPVPEGSVGIGFAVRVRGAGTAKIHEFTLDHPAVDPPIVPRCADYLIVTDHYPAYDDLYRNGFVHSRVKGYRGAGLEVDVFRFREAEMLSYHEFEGVEVATGSTHALRATLSRGRYKHVLVHFLNPGMWSVLSEFADELAITVWVHGVEVQPWWRRKFNYNTAPDIERAKIASDARMRFWRSVLDDIKPDTHFVFVSQRFRDEVFQDLEREIPIDQVHVVHNPVNTTLFDYVPKPADQRLRILSIRPYASATYANDLAVAAVKDLAKEEWFSDLQFRFVGDGPLFDEILGPIKGWPNVELLRGFLTQPEIAAMHKEFGVFLAPTRCDSQGVSKDEAMSSGLVPVTSDVAAIPEFVSSDEGFLAPFDDHIELANAIRTLHEEPETFRMKSAAAARRVRSQTAMPVVLPQELGLLRRIASARRSRDLS